MGEIEALTLIGEAEASPLTALIHIRVSQTGLRATTPDK
jgi:hypothetical protein